MTSPPPAPPVDPPAAWPPPAAPAPRTQLRRSRTDKILGGVNGGLAEYSGIDVLLWRVGFVALAFAGGTGVVVYLLLWLLMPAGPAGSGVETTGTALIRPRRPAGPRSPIPRITVATGLIVLGVLTLVDRFTGADLGPRAFLGTGLLVVGLGLVATALAGTRSGRGGLIALGVVLALALITTAADPWEGGRGVGDRTYRPATAAEVQPVYRNGVGELTIDLRRIDVRDLDEAIDIDVEHGVGELDIVLPRDADVQLRVDNGIGSIELFGADGAEDGFFPGTGSGSWVDDGEPEFDIRINNGVGDVEVSRA
jgi:phage shock protein PspC (stress-responsive transcriptional regulator)